MELGISAPMSATERFLTSSDNPVIQLVAATDIGRQVTAFGEWPGVGPCVFAPLSQPLAAQSGRGMDEMLCRRPARNAGAPNAGSAFNRTAVAQGEQGGGRAWRGSPRLSKGAVHVSEETE
jgi:hypothetical protein